MIAGCTTSADEGDCATCVRRNACAGLWTGRDGLFGLLFREIAAAAARHRQQRPMPAFRRRVEKELGAMLERGAPGGIDAVASALGCSRNTLYRRLKMEDTTFEQVRDGLRRKRATAWMRSGVSVKETAYRLGFSDPAAFSRAFKRWTGTNPSTVRDS